MTISLKRTDFEVKKIADHRLYIGRFQCLPNETYTLFITITNLI